MTKKRIIIILLLVALIVGGVAAYFIYFKKLPAIPFLTPSGQITQETPVPGEVAAPAEKLKKISAGGVVSPATTPDGAHIHYVGKNGDIYEIGFDGALITKTPFTALQNLIEVLWAKDHASFAALYGDPDGKKFFYYDPEKKQASPYARTLDALAFSHSQNKSAYHSSEGLTGTPFIATADLDGASAQTVLQARMRDITLSWIADDELAVSTIPSGLAPNMLWDVNTTSKKLTAILSDLYGLTVQWAPSGTHFLFAQTNSQGKNLSLSFSDKKGLEIKSIPLATLPEKCVFSHDEKSIVCAVPSTTPDLVWPDDYYKKLYTAQEQIWRVDLATGKKDMLYEFPNISFFDVSNLLLSPSEDSLFFINRKDGELYRLALQ